MAGRAASRSIPKPAEAARANPSAGDAGLELLDEFLASERAPEDAMLLSDLDGFLTAIAIGPELILPSEWLPVIWGGNEGPKFADAAEANAVLGAIMHRYNDILRQIDEGAFTPIYWELADGIVIAADWAEGFLTAIGLRLDEWKKLLDSKRDGSMLFPILALCGNEDGESLLDIPLEDEDEIMSEAAEMLPLAVIGIASYWRVKAHRGMARPPGSAGRGEPERTRAKVGRNDPCPCGSGKKFKRCCAGKDEELT